jgi:hypothetical protein
MRREIIELGKLGPLPSSGVAVRDHLEQLVDQYAQSLDSIQKPVTDEEARSLVRLFGPDDCFGIVWSLIDLIETAPGWPLEDCLMDTSNTWVAFLKQRVENSRRLGETPGR